MANKNMQKLTENVSDEQVTRNLEQIPVKNDFVRKNLVTFGAVLSILFLFLPFVKFKAENEYANNATVVSGLQTMFGSYHTILSVIIFLIPIALILMNFISVLHPFRRILSVCGPIASILFEIIVFVAVRSTYLKATSGAADMGGTDVSAVPQIGFFLLMISYVLTAVVGYITYFGMTKKMNK